MSISVDSALYQKLTETVKSDSKASKLSSSLSNLNTETATDEEMMEACKSFEAYLVEQVIKTTKKAMLKDEDGEGDYMKYFGDTLHQEYANIITESGELGIAKMLYESMKRNSSSGISSKLQDETGDT